ncbi:MAG TPA: DUF5668 domain-containing protein [Duganella sp.]|nr:DUF5668 domain-containing protein [Duganella sp.]
MNAEIAYQWRKQLVWGLLMIAVGCAFLLERAGYIDFDVDITRLWRYWPWLVVISGITQIIPPTTPKYLLGGLGSIFFAGWWYVSFNRIWGWGFGDTWPALIVACGVGMLLRPLLDNIFAADGERK